MENLCFAPIGVIRSPFEKPEDMPIQAKGAQGVSGRIELAPELVEGLQDLDGFSHIILLYQFHLSKGYSLKVKPFLDDRMHGVFATRAPRRPNLIGISIVRLVSVEGNALHIEDVDVVDGTPLLDIKPYVPEFDVRDAERIGWLKDTVHNVAKARSDARFKS